MHETIINIGGAGLTGWALVGLLGSVLFTGRWVVQAIYSARADRSVTPRLFWYMSILGNLLILSYFIFGALDYVGIVSNLFPVLVASYNIFLLWKAERMNNENK